MRCEKLKSDTAKNNNKKANLIIKNKAKKWHWVGDGVLTQIQGLQVRVREDESETITDHMSWEIGKIDYY